MRLPCHTIDRHKKPIYMNTQLKDVISKLILVTLLFTAVITAQAQTPAIVAGEKETPAFVKYIGTQDDMFVFTVAYSNPEGTAFTIIVKDQEGDKLYQSTFKEKDFNRQFRLPTSDKNSKVVFIFRDAKGNDMAKAFEIKVNSRYIDEVAVKKLK
jgi:predicted amidohydrolase